jgi:methionyl-tRNA formyltransferase
VLAAGGRGFVNLHFSLLPRWRGAAPVQHAIRAGDAATGVTTFVLDRGMDTGPLLSQAKVEIGAQESAGVLLDRLAVLGAPVLVDAIRDLVGGATPLPQPDDGVTLAPKITPEDVLIDLSAPVHEAVNLVRSADPAPGAHTTFRGERLKVYRAAPVELASTARSHPDAGAAVREDAADVADAGDATDAERAGAAAGDGTAVVGPPDPADALPGTIVRVDKRGPVVACRDGGVRLEQLQPTGKARMDGAAFVNGYRPKVGERLGEPS